MASVNDPMKFWRDMIEQQKAGFGSNAEMMQMMFAPMQQQLDLMQKALETQAEFNRELTEQAFAPMRQALEGPKQAAATTRAAGEALKEAGNLLTQQATAMDQALSFTSPFLDSQPLAKDERKQSSGSCARCTRAIWPSRRGRHRMPARGHRVDRHQGGDASSRRRP